MRSGKFVEKLQVKNIVVDCPEGHRKRLLTTTDLFEKGRFYCTKCDKVYRLPDEAMHRCQACNQETPLDDEEQFLKIVYDLRDDGWVVERDPERQERRTDASINADYSGDCSSCKACGQMTSLGPYGMMMSIQSYFNEIGYVIRTSEDARPEITACTDGVEHSWEYRSVVGISFRKCMKCNKMQRRLYRPWYEDFGLNDGGWDSGTPMEDQDNAPGIEVVYG